MNRVVEGRGRGHSVLEPLTSCPTPAELAAREFGRARAGDGVPLSAIEAAYRVAFRFLGDEFADVAVREGVLAAAALGIGTEIMRAADEHPREMPELARSQRGPAQHGHRLGLVAPARRRDRRGPPVVVFDRDPLSVAAASAPDIMPRLARTVPAALDDLPADDRALLLETFGAWFDSGGSAEQTARELFVHPNTVRYRLRRLEERTGRSLSDPRWVAELSLAYEIDRRLTAGRFPEGAGATASGPGPASGPAGPAAAVPEG